MLLGYREQATDSSCTADPQFQNAGSPLWRPGDSHPICMPERRRIVALVRREGLKNLGFFAFRKKAAMMRRFVDIDR
jgi:hypothetical protein